MSENLKWLHISDLHLTSGAPLDQNRVFNALIRSAPDIIKRYGSPDLVFFTGDLGYRGAATDYTNASAVFDQIAAAFELDRSGIFVVPGNHDADRSRAHLFNRNYSDHVSIDRIFDGRDLSVISERFSEFRSWYDTYFAGIRQFSVNSTVFNISECEINGVRSCIISVNSAAYSFDDQDQGNLIIGYSELERVFNKIKSEEFDIKFLLMHHPVDWISAAEMLRCKTIIRDNCDVVLSGHLHENDAEQILDCDGSTAFIRAGALYQDGLWPKSAFIGERGFGALRIVPLVYTSSPRPVWTLDTSLYPSEFDFTRRIPIGPEYADLDSAVVELSHAESTSTVPEGRKQALWRDQLFQTPTGQTLYAEPRIASVSQGQAAEQGDSVAFVTVAELCSYAESVVIEVRPEYGGTLLGGRLVDEFSKLGVIALFRDARKLPNYASKLREEIKLTAGGFPGVVIIDNFDIERDERLLRELKGLNAVPRVVLLSMHRGISPSVDIDLAKTSFEPRRLYLWTLGRTQIRELASTFFETKDDALVSRLVDKVYQDLLNLCIPLTPSNVVMYLKVLFSEGEFVPVNKVDIYARFLSESLRKPSDSYGGNFNYRNRMDVIASLAGKLFVESKNSFTEREWHRFCADYSDHTLLDFSSSELLEHALSSKVITEFDGKYYFRYRFFYVFFLGKCIANNQEILTDFLNTKSYLSIPDVMDVISSFTSNNPLAIESLTTHLSEGIAEFERDVAESGFDPLLGASWPRLENEEEAVWRPIADAIEAGPATTDEVDSLKTSYLAEARTANQNVVLQKFRQLEFTLFSCRLALQDVLRNVDDVGAENKLKAYEKLLKCELAAFQLGTIFAPELASSRIYRWGVVTFMDFNRAAEEFSPQSAEAIARVVLSLSNAVVHKSAGEIAFSKLSKVFALFAERRLDFNFLDVLNFSHIITAKGSGWEDSAKSIIDRCDTHSYYLFMLSNIIIRDVKQNILKAGDVKKAKSLLGVIQAKRSLSKMRPKPGEVSNVLAKLERTSFFRTLFSPPKSGK